MPTPPPHNINKACTPDVSVIIVNFKTSSLIIECLKSLFRLTHGLEMEIIIVDNNSEPDFKQLIAGAFPSANNIIYLALPENIGFGRANNEGYSISSGRNILFLNPDTVLLNNAVKILSDFLDSHPCAGACGANIFNELMQPSLSHKRLVPGVRWELIELAHNLPLKIFYRDGWDHNYSGRPMEVGYITGADLMVKRATLEQTGAFSPEFFMYYEETELCTRIRRHGWKIFNIPDAHIQHLDGQSFDKSLTINTFKIETQEKSRNIFYRLTAGRFRRSISDVLYRLFLASRISLSRNPVKKESYRLRRKFHKAHRLP